MQNKSKLKRILSADKGLDSLSNDEETEDTSLKLTVKKKAPHLDIDARDENGASPLILAALNGHRSVVLVLLSYSAEVRAVDNQG